MANLSVCLSQHWRLTSAWPFPRLALEPLYSYAWVCLSLVFIGRLSMWVSFTSALVTGLCVFWGYSLFIKSALTGETKGP